MTAAQGQGQWHRLFKAAARIVSTDIALAKASVSPRGQGSLLIHSGTGKEYLLAKRYLELLPTAEEEERGWENLRHPGELSWPGVPRFCYYTSHLSPGRCLCLNTSNHWELTTSLGNLSGLSPQWAEVDLNLSPDGFSSHPKPWICHPG